MTNFCERCNGYGWADASCVRLCDDCNGNGITVPTELEILTEQNQLFRTALTKIAFRCLSFVGDDRPMQVPSIQAILTICDSALD